MASEWTSTAELNAMWNRDDLTPGTRSLHGNIAESASIGYTLVRSASSSGLLGAIPTSGPRIAREWAPHRSGWPRPPRIVGNDEAGGHFVFDQLAVDLP